MTDAIDALDEIRAAWDRMLERNAALEAELAQYRERESDSDDLDLSWAAGVFSAQSSVGLANDRHQASYGERVYKRIYFQVCLWDEQVAERLAKILGANARPRVQPYSQTFSWVVVMSGRNAELALGLLWPWIEDTDKAKEIKIMAEELGVHEWVTGLRRDRRPRPTPLMRPEED